MFIHCFLKALTSEYVVESVPDLVAPGDVCAVGEVLRLPAQVLDNTRMRKKTRSGCNGSRCQ